MRERGGAERRRKEMEQMGERGNSNGRAEREV